MHVGAVEDVLLLVGVELDLAHVGVVGETAAGRRKGRATAVEEDAVRAEVVELHLEEALDSRSPWTFSRTRPPRGDSTTRSKGRAGSVESGIESPRGGRVRLRIQGDLSTGLFEMGLDNYSPNGVFLYGGSASFSTAGGGFTHNADVRQVELDTDEEENVFYRADMHVDWDGGTGGSIESSSRSGHPAAVWDGTIFAPQGRWKAGNRGPKPVPGAARCRRRA